MTGLTGSTGVTRRVTLKYFAWVREKIGIGEETAELDGRIVTAADLIASLRLRGEHYEAAFSHRGGVRVALDKVHAELGTPIGKASEIAFFPPVTGG